MQVFIDESGNFVPSEGVCVVCAMSVPDEMVGRIRREIEKTCKNWPLVEGEIKGSQLGAEHIIRLTEILKAHGVLVHCCAMDVQNEDDDETMAHKNNQGMALIEHLTPEHHPSLVEQVHKLKARLEKMPIQLYRQMQLTFETIYNTAQDSALYYSQRKPKELASYEWFVDAKNSSKVTDQEDWWLTTMGPLGESRTERRPLITVREQGFNYRYFDRSYAFVKSKWRPDRPREIVEGIDIRKLVSQKVKFVDSKSDRMLQAVDAIGNYLRRILNGKVNEISVISAVGGLLIHQKPKGVLQNIQVITLTGKSNASKSVSDRIKLLGKFGRSMIKH